MDQSLEQHSGLHHIPLLVPSNGRSNIVEGGFCCKGGDFIHGDDTIFIGDRDDPTADVSISMSTREMMYGSQGEELYALVTMYSCHGMDSSRRKWDYRRRSMRYDRVSDMTPISLPL